ncbi:MAG: diphthine--ammonia ligase [Rhizobacter sp.]|nr:diphthine--ammonia ligase [Ferruginibacter sp.]
MNWSGGKDSSLSLYKILQNDQYRVCTLLTNVSSTHDRISMHGVRRSLLHAQADAVGIPLQTIELSDQPSMAVYEQAMQLKVVELKSDGYTTAIFGDIFLEDLKLYREKKLAAEDMQCVFPLWKMDTREVMEEFLALGFKSVIVCVNEEFLDQSFCGRVIDNSFLKDLPANVDPCGENGEYHTFVFDGPIFRQPVKFKKGELVRKTYPAPASINKSQNPIDRESEYGFVFCDLI